MKHGQHRSFLEIAMKVHQAFALVDVDYEKVFTADAFLTNAKVHLAELIGEMSKHNGLNYVPRERTPQGRVFEHAADARVMVDHLMSFESVEQQK